MAQVLVIRFGFELKRFPQTMERFLALQDE